MAAVNRSSASIRYSVLSVSSRSSFPRSAAIASAIVAFSCSAMYSVFIMPPALRVGFHYVGELPRDRIRRDRLLESANPSRRQHTLADSPQDAADADIDVTHDERVASAVVDHVHGDVVYADDATAGHVDDL